VAYAAQSVGIDIGGTAIKAGAITPEGKILAERSVEPHFERGPQAVLDAIADVARELGAREGLGIGVPGLLKLESGFLIDSPNLPGFRNLPVPQEIARRLGCAPEGVRVWNDAKVAALGELWLGAARGERHALVLTLGTGIGGGLIFDGSVYFGSGMAGEVGHIVIDPEGPPCGCGGRGCLETLASASAAQRRALAAGLPASRPGDLKLLADRARSGSEPEAQLLREIGRDLGRGLGPVVCLLDLTCFVFGGGFSAALDTLERGIREGIDERSYGERGSKVRLVPAQLGPAAGWIGAARLAMAH
jgi:glucokinase